MPPSSQAPRLPASSARWILAATLMAESAWLSALYSIIGLASDAPGAALSWPVVLLIMGVSLVITHLNPSTDRWITRAYRFRTPIGLVLIYLAAAAQLGQGASVDFGWAWTVVVGDGGGGYRLAAGIGFALGIVAWWRGAKIASAELLNESLKITMGVGAAALAFAALVDIAHEADLNTAARIFVFFAAGLSGLGMHRLFEGASRSAKAGGWQSILLGPVSIVLTLGIAFSLLSRGVLSGISEPASALLGKVAAVLFWAIVVPIGTLFNLAVAGFLKFFSRPYDPAFEQQTEITVEEVREGVQQAALEEAELAEEGVQTGYALLLQIIEWTVISILGAIALVVAVFLFSRAYRRMLKPPDGPEGPDRESVREDADPLSDLGGLLSKLGGRWTRRRKREQMPLPDGPPGIVEPMRLYYQMLDAAERRGIARQPHQTPQEHRGPLSRLFPHDIVAAITHAFDRAFYGNHPTDLDRLAEISRSVEGLDAPGRLRRQS